MSSYYNECEGGDDETGGDDGPITDPGLPELPSIICPRADSGCGDLPSNQDIVEATSKWPKVDWARTATSCSKDDFNTLVTAHGKAVEMMRFTPTFNNGGFETTGFNRYFASSALWFEGNANTWFSNQAGIVGCHFT
jgi:hypothetical protein